MQNALSREEIIQQLDAVLEVEFSFLHTDSIAAQIVGLGRDAQAFILQWTRRVATTNIQLAFEFCSRSGSALECMDRDMISAWCLQAMDTYDRAGLHPAMSVIKDLRGFVEYGHLRANAALLEQNSPVLSAFLQGLSGRRLKLEEAKQDQAWTDGETLYLPAMLAKLDDAEQNFQLYKSIATHLWAQTRYGSLNADPDDLFDGYEDRAHAAHWFHVLETLRLDRYLQRDLPGLYRQMQALLLQLQGAEAVDAWRNIERELQPAFWHVAGSIRILPQVYARKAPQLPCYAGSMDLHKAWAARQIRQQRDKARFREALRVLFEDMQPEGMEGGFPPVALHDRQPEQEPGDLPELELIVADQVMPLPEHMQQLLTSIQLDLSEIPEDYLVPAGEGEYEPSLLQDENLDADDVWAGTYHEEGADFYDEWDFGRQHYRKRWCVLREVEIQAGDADLYSRTIAKYRGLVKSLHRTFEVLRGEDKMLRRQPDGEDLDIDAIVESWAEMHSGMEMSERLFTRMHKDERNIAVLFMVDMSGSTKGWINEAEKEALVLLVESLQILGDRYAIYGFSGWARKRCEAYHIKSFEEPLDNEVKRRIAGIEPRDYTRMGAAIRHFTRKLLEVEARTKLLITLSDGKPDDYDHYYRGEYGIEDTRQALFEARVAGVHPFCITIDQEGADYLPHMYGKANYVVLDEVGKLPLKVSDIYRKITS